MRNLPCPDHDDAVAELEVSIAPGKTKRSKPGYVLSRAEKSEIESLYKRYDDTSATPSTALKSPKLDAALCDLICDAYRHIQKGGRHSALRDRLMLSIDRCPYCGINSVTDLDHHLPRSVYKALAVYSPNLIPCCHQCNGLKDTAGSVVGRAAFIHAYLDRIPDERFLAVTTHTGGGTLRAIFSVQQSPSMSPLFAHRLRTQFKQLKLGERYQPEVNLFLCGQIVALKFAYGPQKDASRLRRYLTKTAEVHECNLGLNDWRAALLRGLSLDVGFCCGGFVAAFG